MLKIEAVNFPAWSSSAATSLEASSEALCRNAGFFHNQNTVLNQNTIMQDGTFIDAIARVSGVW